MEDKTTADKVFGGFGERLKNSRKIAGKKQSEVALYLGMTLNKASGQATSYGFYEQGIREPGVEKIRKICQFLNVSADYLFGLSDDLTPEIKQLSDYTTDDLLAELKRRWNNYGG